MGQGSHGPTGPTSVNQTVLFPANGNEGRARKDVPRCPRGLPPVCSAYVSVWLCHRGHGRRKEEQAERTHSSFRSWICRGPEPNTQKPHVATKQNTAQALEGGKTAVNFQATAARARGAGEAAAHHQAQQTATWGGPAVLRTMWHDAVLPTSGVLASLSSCDRTCTQWHGAGDSIGVGCALLQPRRTLTSRAPGVARGLEKWRVSQESAAALSPAGRAPDAEVACT